MKAPSEKRSGEDGRDEGDDEFERRLAQIEGQLRRNTLERVQDQDESYGRNND